MDYVLIAVFGIGISLLIGILSSIARDVNELSDYLEEINKKGEEDERV